MAITTYAELKTAIGNWLARTDLTSYYDDFIDLAEARHKRDMRLRAMETRATGSLTADSRLLALPTGFVEARRFILTASPRHTLRFVTPDQLTGVYNQQTAGKPDFFTVHDQFEFNRPCDSTYAYELLHYAAFTALSDSNTTNWLITNAPDVYLWSCLAESAPFIGDDQRAALWEAKYQQAKADLLSVDAKGSLHGGVLTTKTDVYNP